MTGTCTLVFETSTPHASLALLGVNGQIEQREFTGDRSHNATLFAPLKDLLDSRSSALVSLVLVGSGPGSYSGTRVGIAAAQGVAIASGCPAVAVPSILAVPSAMNGAACLAIGDARRGSYWTAGIRNSALVTDPQLTDAEGLEIIVRENLAAGIPVFSFEDPARFPLSPELRGQVLLEFPNAERLLQSWNIAEPETREQWTAQPPQPMYLKPPHITPAKQPWLIQPQA